MRPVLNLAAAGARARNGILSVSPCWSSAQSGASSASVRLVLGCGLGLLAVTRSDGCLLAAAAIGWIGFRRPRTTAITVLGPFVAICALWAVASWALTGALFPSTLAAKLAQRDSGSFGKPLNNFLVGASSNGIMGVEAVSPPVSLAAALVLVASLLLPIVAIFATVVAYRRGEQVLPILAVAATINMVEYGVIFRMPAGYVWHYGPWALWITAGLAVALEEAVRRNHRLVGSFAVAVSVLILITANHLQWNSLKLTRSHYREAAEWIDRDARSLYPTVAAAEIGTIGYYSRADMVDYFGLLDPKAQDWVRRNDFTFWLTAKPDYWVATKGPVDDPTLALAEFRRHYVPATRFGPLTVYRRIAS